MSMIQNFLRVNSETLNSFLTDSHLLRNMVYSKEAIHLNNLIDIDKAWEGIFFLLTGESIGTYDQALPPLSWLLVGPNDIDRNQDMGYGPATYTDIEQTRRIDLALQETSAEELTQRFDSITMLEKDIYPTIWDEENALDYLLQYFEDLKAFYHMAALQHEAVILFLN
ncbi:YfbM family protein [Sphingobacterium sp.]|uniref:YfbM family protein n=1 Tax=Sphingobacterium sp. TaxID=341027 RepID=UPI0031D81028